MISRPETEVFEEYHDILDEASFPMLGFRSYLLRPKSWPLDLRIAWRFGHADKWYFSATTSDRVILALFSKLRMAMKGGYTPNGAIQEIRRHRKQVVIAQFKKHRLKIRDAQDLKEYRKLPNFGIF